MCEGRDESKSKHDFDMSRNDGCFHVEPSVNKHISLHESILLDDEGDSDDDNSFEEETCSLESESHQNELQQCQSSDTDILRKSSVCSHDDRYQRRPTASQESSSTDGFENSVKITVVTQDFHRINERFNSPFKPKKIPKHKVTTSSRTCTPWFSMMTTLNEINLPYCIGRGGRSRSTSDRSCQHKLSPNVHQANLQYKSWGDIVVSYQWMCDRLSQQVATTSILVNDWNLHRKNAVIALTKNKDLIPFTNEHKIGEEPQLIGRFRKPKSKSMNWNASIRNEIFALMSKSSRQNNADDDDETASSSSSSSSQESESMCMTAITSNRILGKGIPYKITRTILVGWLYKKGTGMDILQSFSWKVRYAKLCLAYVYCLEYGDGVLEVPLLCLYWYERSQTPCTVIVLDTAVVLSVQEENIHISQNESDKEILAKLNDSFHAGEKNRRKLLFPMSTTSKVDVSSTMQAKYFFELRHATSKQNCTLPITRSFATLSTRSRDEWVYRISEALLIYNKTKQQRRKTQLQAATYILRSPQRFSSCVVDHALTTVSGGRSDLVSRDGKNRVDGISYQQMSLNAENKMQLSVIDPLGSDLNGVYGHRGVRRSGDKTRHSSQWQEVMPTSTPSTTSTRDLSISNLPKVPNSTKSTLEPSERPPILPIRLRPSSPTGLEIEITID